MCYNCGCLIPDDNMGSEDNITTDSFLLLSKQWGISLEKTKRYVYALLYKHAHGQKTEEDAFIKTMFTNATRAWGQSEEEARKNTYELLKQEFKDK